VSDARAYTDLEKATMLYDSVAAELGGCSDGYCIIKGRANGQHTNGGCRCLSRPADVNPFQLKKLARAARMMRDAIRAIDTFRKSK
jgi:hypothetical protein